MPRAAHAGDQRAQCRGQVDRPEDDGRTAFRGMVQSGLLVPVHPEQRVWPVQVQYLTDIGDNQSIENQLSTYSYQAQPDEGLSVRQRRTKQRCCCSMNSAQAATPSWVGHWPRSSFEELYAKALLLAWSPRTTPTSRPGRRRWHKPSTAACCLTARASLLPTGLDLGQPGSSFTFEVAELNGIARGPHGSGKRANWTRKRCRLDGLIASVCKRKRRATSRLNGPTAQSRA